MFTMDSYAEKNGDIRKVKLKDFHKKVKAVLNHTDRDNLYGSLKKYQAERRLDKLLNALKTLLNTPTKLNLLTDIRSFIPPHQVSKYDDEVPYHNMAHPRRSWSATKPRGRSHSLQRFTHSQPSSLQNTPRNIRRHASNEIFQTREGPMVKVFTIYLGHGDNLGFSVRGGSEHGLGIFVSEVETGSAAERDGLLLGDQILEVNTISFDGIGSSSAVKVLTGSERLKMMVRRVGKVPGFKSTKEKIAWYDVELKRLVRGDSASHSAVRIPGQVGLAGHDRKINLNKLSRDRPHLGFNIRGGSEFNLGIYVSRTDPGGLAEQNGLKAGDQLIEVNGINIVNRTHDDVVNLIKAQKTLILTVRDIGKFPAFKEIYAEYKWVDVNTGHITKTRSYKKHALETTGHIQSIPIHSSCEDIFREQFSESKIDSIGEDHEAFDSDGLDDVLMYLDRSPEHTLQRRLPVQEETFLHSDIIQVPLSPKVKIRNGLTQSLDNIHSVSKRDTELDRVVPVSPLSRTTSEKNLPMAVSMQNLNGGGYRRMYTPNVGKKSSNLWGGDYTDDEDDRLFYPRQKSAMENAMENAMVFQSIHDIPIASTSSQYGAPSNSSWMNDDSDHNESVLVPRQNTDIVMIERMNESEEENKGGSAKGSVRSNRSKKDKSPTPRASLAVQALQNEARKNYPEFASEAERMEHKKQERTEFVDSLKGNKGEVKGAENGSKSSKSRSIRQFLFGSKSKEKQDSKKKSRRSRKPLSSINFDQDGGFSNKTRDNTVIYQEIEEAAEGILTHDEVTAVIRHLKNYESRGAVSQLVGQLFAILDTSKKMILCTHIRRIISEVDHKVFDDAVNRQFDILDTKQQSKHRSGSVSSRASLMNSSTASISSKPPPGNHCSSMVKENTHRQQPTPKRVKRQAPLPPTSQQSSVTSEHKVTVRQKNDLSQTSDNQDYTKDTSVSNISSTSSKSQSSFISESYHSDYRGSKQNISILSNGTTDSSSILNKSSTISKSKSLEVSKESSNVVSSKLTKIDKSKSVEGDLQSTANSAPQVVSTVPPAPPPPPPLPVSPFAPSPRVRKSSLESITSTDGRNIEGKSFRKLTMDRVTTNDKTIFNQITQFDNQNLNNVNRRSSNKDKSSTKRQAIYCESNDFESNPKGSNFIEMANQKLEQYKQSSGHGSKESLNHISDSEDGTVSHNKHGSNGFGANQDIGEVKNNLMAELQMHLGQVKNKLESTTKVETQPVRSTSPDRMSTAGSAYTAVGSVRRRLKGTDRDLAQDEYMDSADMFSGPANIIGSPSTIRSERFNTLENSQTDSVLQATNALAFLDNLECSDLSHVMDLSSISRATSHVAEEVTTPSSEVSDASEATSRFGSYDVNPDLSLSLSASGQNFNISGAQRSAESTLSRRDPPVFIAPPPPEEPPPSDSEDRYSLASSLSDGSIIHSPDHKVIPGTNNYRTDTKQSDTSSLRSFNKSRQQVLHRLNGYGPHDMHFKSLNSSIDESESPRYDGNHVHSPNLSINSDKVNSPFHKQDTSPDSSMDERSFESPEHSRNQGNYGSSLQNISSIKSPESTVTYGDNDSLFAFLSEESYVDSNKTEQQNEERKSWLFRNAVKSTPVKPIDSSTIGSSSGKIKQEEVQSFFSQTGHTHSDKTRDVYLDKSCKTIGLSISGGTDSKLQPEIKIKSIFPGGAAETEGSLKPGLQIVSIDETSLVDVTHMRAVVTIKRSFDNKSNPLMKMIVSENQ